MIGPRLRASPERGESWLSRLEELAGGIVWTSRDTHERLELASMIASPVTTGRRIAVVGPRRGSGTSTVAALLALTFAHFRRDRVLAVDADPRPRSMPARLGAREQGLSRLGARLWVLDQPARAEGLARHFAVSVADHAARSHDFRNAHALVMVVTGHDDAETVLSRCPPGAIPVVIADRPGAASRAYDAVWLGFDRHLDAGTAINPSLLAASTRLAAMRIAAHAMAAATPSRP